MQPNHMTESHSHNDHQKKTDMTEYYVLWGSIYKPLKLINGESLNTFVEGDIDKEGA